MTLFILLTSYSYDQTTATKLHY